MTALPQIITNSASSKGQNINSRSTQESRSHSVPGQKLGSGELVSRSSRSGRRGRIGMPLAPGALWDCLSQTWCVTWRRRSKPSNTQVPTSNLTEDNRKKHCNLTKPNSNTSQTWCVGLLVEEGKTNRSGITPDPAGHRPQRPYSYAQGRTRAKQDKAQASAQAQNQTRSVGGATTRGRRTRQTSDSVPV